MLKIKTLAFSISISLGVFSTPQAYAMFYPEEQMNALAENFSKCSPFKQKFNHAMTKEPLEREILGMKRGFCLFKEGMPNNGMLKCAYHKTYLSKISAYYKKVAGLKNAASVKFSYDGEKSVTIVDGEELSDPMQDALETGNCKVTGY